MPADSDGAEAALTRERLSRGKVGSSQAAAKSSAPVDADDPPEAETTEGPEVEACKAP